jgi:fructosamine-3-kinase
MPMNDVGSVTRVLSAALGGDWKVHPLNASGFCTTWRAQRRGDQAFVKSLPAVQGDVLEAEADGLRAIAAMRALRVPAVRWCGTDVDLQVSVLALEWLDLRAPDAGFGERLGRMLANLHTAVPNGAGRFGWHRDNRIGATPQRNAWHDDWQRFFAVERLGAMREQLTGEGESDSLLDAVDEIIEAVPAFFADGHRPRASLIHGDLWSGNWGMLADGTPVVYDPAVSCSDAEAELAMMELFGVPPEGFWEAYGAVAPLHAGYLQRRPLYQLYHLLNHALLFGGGYVSQALAVADRLKRDGP